MQWLNVCLLMRNGGIVFIYASQLVFRGYISYTHWQVFKGLMQGLKGLVN